MANEFSEAVTQIEALRKTEGIVGTHSRRAAYNSAISDVLTILHSPAISSDWFERKAALEEGHDVTAGSESHSPAIGGAPKSVYPIRAHVVGCKKALSVPVDLCDCGGHDFIPRQPVGESP